MKYENVSESDTPIRAEKGYWTDTPGTVRLKNKNAGGWTNGNC